MHNAEPPQRSLLPIGRAKATKKIIWLALLPKVYGVAEPDKFITFEDQIMLDHTSFIDGFISSTHVLIEQ